jgi:hypothetical protein
MVNAILKEHLEVHCDFLRRPKIIGWIIGREAQVGSWLLPSPLRALSTADEQHDQRLAAARVIHRVARARIDSKLAQSVADRLGVTEIAEREPAMRSRSKAGGGS